MEALIWTSSREEFDEILMLFFWFFFLNCVLWELAMCARNHNSPHTRVDVSQTLFQVLVDLLGMTLYPGLGRGGSKVLVFLSIRSGGIVNRYISTRTND